MTYLYGVAPSQARGLKLYKFWPAHLLTARRAFTGAWIETQGLVNLRQMSSVAPSQARGLKHVESA